MDPRCTDGSGRPKCPTMDYEWGASVASSHGVPRGARRHAARRPGAPPGPANYPRRRGAAGRRQRRCVPAGTDEPQCEDPRPGLQQRRGEKLLARRLPRCAHGSLRGAGTGARLGTASHMAPRLAPRLPSDVFPVGRRLAQVFETTPSSPTGLGRRGPNRSGFQIRGMSFAECSIDRPSCARRSLLAAGSSHPLPFAARAWPPHTSPVLRPASAAARGDRTSTVPTGEPACARPPGPVSGSARASLTYRVPRRSKVKSSRRAASVQRGAAGAGRSRLGGW